MVRKNGHMVEGRLLLPYYSNGTVQNLIDKSGGLKLSKIISIGIDICRGLQAFQYSRLTEALARRLLRTVT
jgi:hypothetical protein